MKRRSHARRSAVAEPQSPAPALNRDFINAYPPSPAIRARLDQMQAAQKVLEPSGEPVMRYRKVNGILNALAMQIEDGGDHPAVVAHLLAALEVPVRAYVSGPAASKVLLAVEALRKAETQRRP